MDFKPVKSVDANVSNEHQRNWSDELFERKAKSPDHNYDRSRTALNFQVEPGGMITTVDKSRRIGDMVEDIIKKHLRPNARVTAISNHAVMVVFGGNRERMREMTFGSQELNEYEETNGHLIRQPEIERWAKDVYGFVCREFGEENIASFIVHLDETGPHAHCVFVPLTTDGRLCSKEVIGGKNKIEAQQHMRDLHTRLAEVNRKYGLDRGDDIHETGARHRSTAEYNRDLHRENARLETLISDKSEQLTQLEEQIKQAVKRVKGLTTMIANLEKHQNELTSEIAQLEADIESGAGDVSELNRRLADLREQYKSTGKQLADKRFKLKTADRQLAELKDKLDSLDEKREKAQKEYSELTGKQQVQIRMRMTDAVFGRMVVDMRTLLNAMTPVQKAQYDGEFLMAIAEQPNEIIKCAMYLFFGYLDGATQFARTFGGGGSSSDLPWGRNPDEDDRHFAYRCMMQAHKMLKPAQPKRGMGGRK